VVFHDPQVSPTGTFLAFKGVLQITFICKLQCDQTSSASTARRVFTK